MNRSNAAAPEPPQSLPEQLRPLMLTLAGEVAKAVTVNLNEDQLGLMVEATLILLGLGHLSKVQEDLPPTPAKDLRLDLPRYSPWEMMASDLSSDICTIWVHFQYFLVHHATLGFLVQIT